MSSLTRKRILAAATVLAALAFIAATIVTKISQYPAVTTPATNDLFVVESGTTNKNITYANLKAAINLTNTFSVNATNVPTPNVTNSATVTWSINGTNITATSAAGGTTVSVNATNVSTPNFTNSSTVTWAISGSNVTATASTAALTWITLTQIGTNIFGFDPSLGNYFKLTITNTAFIPAPTTLPSTTTPQNIELWILENNIGTWSVTWATNYAFMNRTAPQQTTNANAIDIYTLSAHAFTNNIFSVVQTPYF